VPYAAETGHALSLLLFTGLVKHFLALKPCFAYLVSLLNQLLTKKIYHEKDIVFRIDAYPCFYRFCVSAGN
jgi:hypothetical protein